MPALLKLINRNHLLIIFIILLFNLLLSIDVYGQGSLIQNFKFGFGAGVNFSMVNAGDEFVLYEDLAGNTSTNEYSDVFQNFGNQYFFQAEYHRSGFVAAIKPGTYSYKFSRKNTLFFEDSEISQENDFSLRYFGVPLELKYLLSTNRFQPFIGAVFGWGILLGSGDDENLDFIKNRLSLGAVTGGYYETGFVTLVLSLGYDHGLHVITRKDNRYNTSISTSYSQSDLRLNNLYANITFLFSLEKQRFSSHQKCAYPIR